MIDILKNCAWEYGIVIEILFEYECAINLWNRNGKHFFPLDIISEIFVVH